MQVKQHTNNTKSAIILAVLAALLYGLSSPVSKVLLTKLSPTLMAALLYLGAGLGMLIVNTVKVKTKAHQTEAKITKKEMPYVVGMIVLDIAAPILLMIGLTLTTSGTVALLNNFEIVATSMIALVVFREAIDSRTWLAIGLITLASILLTVGDISSFKLSMGAVFVLGAALCWGLENNCTRMLSLKDPLQIVVIKGFGSGFGALLIAIFIKDLAFDWVYMLIALTLGFVAYGLSIYFYISAQRHLGAARTSAYYAAAPFIGVLASWIILKEPVSLSFFVALVIMLIGSYFAVTENHGHTHVHEVMTHDHKHSHDDGHHMHDHDDHTTKEHSHVHTHKKMKHDHVHTPDLHHSHAH